MSAKIAIVQVTREVDMSYWAEYAMPAMATAYWADNLYQTDDGIIVEWFDDPDDRSDILNIKLLSWQDIADAMVALDKVWDGFDYQGEAYRALLSNAEDADWDIETDDSIIQYAVFGELVYG